MSTNLLKKPYCTLCEAQTEAGNSSSEEAPLLMAEINKASRWLEEHCQRDFLFHDHTSIALVVPESWCAGNVIFLPWPIITLTEVIVDGTALEASQFRHSVRPQSVTSKIERNGNWLEAPAATDGAGPSMAPQIELKGSFGFELATTDPETTPPPGIPGTISQACAAIAAIRSGLVRKEIVGPGGTREAVTVRNIPKEILDSLKNYRLCVT